MGTLPKPDSAWSMVRFRTCKPVVGSEALAGDVQGMPLGLTRGCCTQCFADLAGAPINGVKMCTLSFGAPWQCMHVPSE